MEEEKRSPLFQMGRMVEEEGLEENMRSPLFQMSRMVKEGESIRQGHHCTIGMSPLYEGFRILLNILVS